MDRRVAADFMFGCQRFPLAVYGRPVIATLGILERDLYILDAMVIDLISTVGDPFEKCVDLLAESVSHICSTTSLAVKERVPTAVQILVGQTVQDGITATVGPRLGVFLAVEVFKTARLGLGTENGLPAFLIIIGEGVRKYSYVLQRSPCKVFEENTAFVLIPYSYTSVPVFFSRTKFRRGFLIFLGLGFDFSSCKINSQSEGEEQQDCCSHTEA